MEFLDILGELWPREAFDDLKSAFFGNLWAIVN